MKLQFVEADYTTNICNNHEDQPSEASLLLTKAKKLIVQMVLKMHRKN